MWLKQVTFYWAVYHLCGHVTEWLWEWVCQCNTAVGESDGSPAPTKTTNEEKLTNPLQKEQWAQLPWCISMLMKVRWCEEGVCGCGDGERHKHSVWAVFCSWQRPSGQNVLHYRFELLLRVLLGSNFAVHLECSMSLYQIIRERTVGWCLFTVW